MVFIKICGITSLEDAEAAISAGGDSLGFNFYPGSPRYITPQAASRIISRIPPHVFTVGVFVNQGAPSAVARMADEAGVAAVQLHGDETPAYCEALSDRFVIKALRVGDGFVPECVNDYRTAAILLDAYVAGAHGGTGRVFDWELARQTRELTPRLFLAGGLSPENVAEAVSVVQPYAVDACSRLERAPGKKDRDLLNAFVEAARAGC